MKNTFARSQRIMHWLVLLMIVIAYAAMELKGFTTKGSAPRALLVLTHYTAGVSVLILMVVRVGLKLTHHDPDIIPQPPRWQTISAKAVHGLLYLMFLSLPLLGVLSLYAAAALFHHYIVRDNTLERMLPFMHPRANRK